MKALWRAEFRKLRTTRTIYGFFMAMVAVGAATILDVPDKATTQDWHSQQFVFFTSFMTRVLILVVGIRLVTDEFRHGTVVPALLAAPNRMRLLIAKLCTGALTGLVLAAVAAVTMIGTGAVVGAFVGLSFDGDAARVLGGFVLAGALWAVMGVGLGTLIRNQIIAIVGGLVWLMAMEDAVRSALGDSGKYLPGNAGLAMIVAPDWGLALTAGSIFATACIVVVGASAIAFTHRDVE